MEKEYVYLVFVGDEHGEYEDVHSAFKTEDEAEAQASAINSSGGFVATVKAMELS